MNKRQLTVRILVAGSTFLLGVTAALLLIFRSSPSQGFKAPDLHPAAPQAQAPPPPATSVTPPPVQEAAAETAMEQDCQTCGRVDAYCELCFYFEAIEIMSHEEENEIAFRSFKNLSSHPIYVDLDLSEGIENEVMVRLRGADSQYEYKIEQQYETSLMVSGEGPHMDLTDWKHYRSPWREIKSLGDGKFLTLKLSEADRSRFPAVTMQEVYREVARRDDGGWAELARQAKTLNDGPLMVLVSKFSLRIKVKHDGEWVVLKLLEFFLPTGC